MVTSWARALESTACHAEYRMWRHGPYLPGFLAILATEPTGITSRADSWPSGGGRGHPVAYVA
jgi:hypothetical protein